MFTPVVQYLFGISNEPNEPIKSNEPIEQNESNEPNELNELNEPIKPNESDEPIYTPIPDPHGIFKPTINRVSLPDRYQVSDEHLAIPGVLEITQYNMHAYLFANDESQKKIHRHNLHVANNFLYHMMNKKYRVIKGHMDIYHGNVYNYGNCETHKLYKPECILYDLIESNIDIITRNSITIVSICCDNDFTKIIEIELKESWRNSPIEWKFKLGLKK